MGLMAGNAGGGESFIGIPKSFYTHSTGGQYATLPSNYVTVLNVIGRGILTSITQSVMYSDSTTGGEAIRGTVEIIIDGVSQKIDLATMGKSGSSITPMFKFYNSLVIRHWQNSNCAVQTTGTYLLQ